MKKGGFLRNVLDTIRSNQTTGQSGRGSSTSSTNDRGVEYGGQLKPSHFSLAQIARHGFPEHPTALAFDPVQKIAAIGTKSGAIRIFGRPGVDVWAQHEPAFAVTHIKFVVNQGAIITVTSDESIHLWSLRGPNLRLQLSGATSSSPQMTGGNSVSPAPTTASNLSSVSPLSGASTATATGFSAAASPSSLLGQITDTVSGAVDSASEFLSGGGNSSDLQATPSPTGEMVAGSMKQTSPKQPERLHTLKFQREHITCLHQTLLSKWLYIGTERGNIHVANVETFELSGYSIAWNKAIELSRKTHPGSIIHISECPQDSNKLLIGYESGCIVLWDLKQRNADGRYYHTENLLWLAWHHEGKQFMASHGDGSLVTWQTRSNTRPVNIQYPHSKTGPTIEQTGVGGHQQVTLASSLARSLNNELYRPINKVEWKTSKSNEQFLLFSGGLPYDGFEHPALLAQDSLAANKPPSRQSAGISPARFATPIGPQQQPSQYLKASSASPSAIAGFSPISPSVSPALQQFDATSSTKPSSALGVAQQQHRQSSSSKKILRSTSLTVMLGKSITVLEMDDTIIDFITICDNSPYENDTSDPYAVIVLLSKELILIDLTSSGYPSFESPYPSSSLSESPVTCVQYLADCSSDLIPFLYSNSQNAVSRAPKKGFSDKEWPINGGEWGQSLQSYPELVLTGHADGTIKFWDMSGINFDLISKIKTSKLFQRPNLPPNATFVIPTPTTNPNKAKKASPPFRPSSPSRSNIMPEQDHHHYQQYSQATTPTLGASCGGNPEIASPEQTHQTAFIENLFAIEKIEFCPSSRHLLVAGAYSQVIQFKLNKKESGAAVGCASGGGDLATILVEPTMIVGNVGSNNNNEQSSTSNVPSGQANQQRNIAQPMQSAATSKQHLLFRTKDHHQVPTVSNATSSSTSGGSSSSSGSHRSRLSGFHAELICLTPLLISNEPPEADFTVLGSTGSPITEPSSISAAYYCLVPPKITALALQETHNILAYAHETGIVLVDIIQKCVIMQATLGDLYGGSSALSNNRDITIQPYATNSILQHHYQSTAGSALQAQLPTATGYSNNTTTTGSNNNNANNGSNNGSPRQPVNNGKLAASGLVSQGDQQQTGLSRGGSPPYDANVNQSSANNSPSSHVQTSTTTTSNSNQEHEIISAPPAGGPSTGTISGPISSLFSKIIDKFDSPFARSRSSSGSSGTAPANGGPTEAAAAAESIQCVAFVDPSAASGPAPNHKSLSSPANGAQSADQAPAGSLALLLGTSAGSVLLVGLTMPDSEDNRILQLQSINAEPMPHAGLKMPGQILCLAPFQCEPRPGQQQSASSSLEGEGAHGPHSPPGGAPAPPVAHHQCAPEPARAALFVAVVSEKEARVYQVPAGAPPDHPQQARPAEPVHHQHSGASGGSGAAGPAADWALGRLFAAGSQLVSRCELSDSSVACRAGLVQMRQPDECCLASYLATGHLLVLPLPRLRPQLLEADLVPLTSRRLADSMQFSRQGHALYQPWPGEIVKFTLSAHYRALLNDMLGATWVARDMPEMPRANFFRSLFSVSQAARQSDRDELFGECAAGKPSRNVARHIGAEGLDKLRAAAVGTMGHELRMAREGLDERGEKLNEIEDRTLSMMNQSESYAQAAHQLAQRMKDKKWYQF